MRAYSDNCEICGQEVLSAELNSIKLANNLKACDNCARIYEALECYKTAADLISKSFVKNG